MDKYQKYILSKYGDSLARLFYRACPIEQEEQGSSIQYLFCDENTNSIIIKQDEDINITRYILILHGKANRYDVLSTVCVLKNQQWEQIPLSPKGYKIIIDFNERIEKIKLSFVNNLADDYIITINYQEADKEKYYAKKEQERKDNLFKTANIKVSTGADLVNIYFQPCCDSYARTEIVLYKDDIMLAKYKVDEETFFKSISGLAYGKYEFILKQFDDKGNIILETDKIAFSINAPHYGVTPRVNRI
jgi:hypothetical protein